MSIPGAPPTRRAVVPAKELSVLLSTGDLLKYDEVGTEGMLRVYWERQHIAFNGGVWTCKRQQMLVMAAMEPTKPFGDLLHVSVSCKTRLPRWDEVTAIKQAFYGDDLDAMMVLPQKIDYVNLHQHCFHLWQTPAQWGIQ